MIDFYILLPDDKYCKIGARTQADAQKRANREFKSKWEITTDKTAIENRKPVEFSPIEVSYGDYREKDLPQQRSGARKRGNVTHTKIRNRNKDARPHSRPKKSSGGDKDS